MHTNRGKFSAWPLLLTMLAIVAVVMAFAQAGKPVPGVAGAALIESSQTPVASATTEYDAKLAAAATEEAYRITELAMPTAGPGTEKPTIEPITSPGETSDARRPAGAGTIFWGAPPIFPSIEYQLTANEWVEHEGENDFLQVFGGAIRNPNDWNDVSQGVVIVVQRNQPSNNGRYLTAGQTGPLNIMDAVGERLILDTANGAIFYFDVPSRQFVDSLNVTAIPSTTTVTPPLPSNTPEQTGYPVSSEAVPTVQMTTDQP